MVEFLRFHVGLAPFFHYYSHLYHPSCRAFRGKAGLLDDFTKMEKRESSRRSHKIGGEAKVVGGGEQMDLDE